MAQNSPNRPARPGEPAGPARLPAPDAMDGHLLDQICAELDSATVSRLMQKAAADFPKRIDELNQCQARRDHAQLQHLSHSLHGAAANMGIIGIAARAHVLESAAGRQDEVAEQSAFSDLQSAMPMAMRAIEAWLSERQ